MPPSPTFITGTYASTSTTLPILQPLHELGQSVILKFYLGFSKANIPLCCGNIIYKVCIRQDTVTPVTNFYLALFKPRRGSGDKFKAA